MINGQLEVSYFVKYIYSILLLPLSLLVKFEKRNCIKIIYSFRYYKHMVVLGFNVDMCCVYIYLAQKETQQIKNDLISCNLLKTVRLI